MEKGPKGAPLEPQCTVSAFDCSEQRHSPTDCLCSLWLVEIVCTLRAVCTLQTVCSLQTVCTALLAQLAHSPSRSQTKQTLQLETRKRPSELPSTDTPDRFCFLFHFAALPQLWLNLGPPFLGRVSGRSRLSCAQTTGKQADRNYRNKRATCSPLIISLASNSSHSLPVALSERPSCAKLPPSGPSSTGSASGQRGPVDVSKVGPT